MEATTLARAGRHVRVPHPPSSLKLDNSSLTPPLHTHPPHSYFTTKDSQRGVFVFRRRQTSKEGQRGFRLSSLGNLLESSVRPCARRYLATLKALTQGICGSLGQEDVRELCDEDWVPAQQFFDGRRVRSAENGTGGARSSMAGAMG